MFRTMSVLALLAILAGCNGSKAAPAADTPKAEEGAEPSHADVYSCPMKCKLEGADKPYEQSEPGKCPVCGMELEKQ